MSDDSVLGSAMEQKTDTNADTDAVNTELGEEGEEIKFNARVPVRLRDAFREVCESEGRSMSWVVREYMRRAVRNGETGL